MVTISNGKETRYVSNGAYKTIYKDKGYHIVSGEHKEVEPEVKKNIVKESSVAVDSEQEVVVSNDVENDGNDWVSDLLEKPISQWSKDEMANFAKEKGIDTSSAHKLSEARDIIKVWIDEHNR